jgi:xanthine dehydrogenase large subunit
VGEPPLMLGISAFSALSDAVQAFGSQYANLQTPATAEAVFHAIARAKDGATL